VPTYYRADWGAQGHVIDFTKVDTTKQIAAVAKGTWKADGTVAQLQAMLPWEQHDLTTRVVGMIGALAGITTQIGALN
jgi:hypothetical protein